MRNAMADAIRDAQGRWQRRADALEHVPHDLAWRGLAQDMNVAHRRAQHSSWRELVEVSLAEMDATLRQLRGEEAGA